MNESRYWRVRIKYGAYEDLTCEAWQRSEVGIWYGAWSAKDLKSALVSQDPLKHLSKANLHNGLRWKDGVRASFLNNARRFTGIDKRDWVTLYFDGTLCLARVCGEVLSSPKHPLNRHRELFKYRKINCKKTFSLNRLPDAFRVLRSAGRGNIFQLRRSQALIKLLGHASNESDVTIALKSKSLDEALELLGPTSWESVCQAYLTIKFDFVPTGLACGRTLADVDIVGRRLSNGARVLAQCKKDPDEADIAAGFLEAIADLHKNDLAFYFAYGGCNGPIPSRVKVVDRHAIETWSKTSHGARYFKWLFGA